MKLSDFSLSARITAAALTTVAAIALTIIFIANGRIRDAFLSEQQVHLEKNGDSEKLRLEQAINTLRQDALFLSNTPPISGIIRAAFNHGYDPRYGNTHQVWAERLEQIFSAFSTAHPDYFQIRFIGVADGGREIVRIDNRGGKVEITPSDRLQAKGDRDYFKATSKLHEKQVFLSQFNLNQEWGVIEQPPRPTLRAATPVFTPSGEMFGMLVINLDVGSLLKPVVSNLPGVQTYLADKEGRYLLHPDSRQAFQFELGGTGKITTDFPFVTSLFNPQMPDYLPLQVVAKKSGRTLFSARRIHFDPSDPSRFLLLLYYIPDAVVAQHIPAMPLKNIVGGLVAMLLVGWAAILVLRRTFSHLKQIAVAADKIAAGEQNILLPQRSGGEIGSLTRALNTMLAKLSQREQEILRINTGLADQVRARTKELEQSQVESRNMLRRYRTLMLTSMDGIFIMDIRGNIVEANAAFCRMLGYTREEVSDLNIADWEAQWPVEALQGGFKKFTGQSVLLETLYRRKDGTLINVEVSINGVELDGLGLLFASSRDITARKQAEANLRIAAAAFKSQESIMITDANGVILRVNQAFTEMTGYTAEEAVGQTPRLLHSDRNNADFYRAMWATIQSTGAWQGEIWDKRKNGEVFPAWLTISAVKGSDGIVTHYVGAHLDISERKAAEEQIHLLAFYDPLTRLPNRRLLLDRLKSALASSARSGRKGALLFVDMDNFKNLNDTLGHDMGDLLLQQVAQRLEPCVREGDTVARLGGDEFVVVLENLSEYALEAVSQAETVCKKIIATLNQPYQLATHEYRSTPSVGATLFNGHEQKSDELFKQADIAMYQAKKAGRNTLRFFDPKMQDSINTRTALENELRKALEDHQFQLYFQIQMDSLRRPLGAEALIRWLHPERGLVLPEQFIPLAEENGLILPIGLWVLDTACAQLKIWQQDALTRDLVLAINVSARQFHQVDFVTQVQAAVQRHAINPERLKLELTESILLKNIEETIATMNVLKEIGIQFSLDDFGSGYSSLQYLKRLPLDQIKIDQSFVRDITVGRDDKAVVSAIIAMANSLNLDVIAEGVEMKVQLQELLNKGCVHYQGYLFGKPVPIEEFESLLK